MRMYKAVIAGILSVFMMATTFICAESVDVGFDKVKSFLFGNSEISKDNLDLNLDEKVDIVDMIIAKGEFQSKASVEVAQLNYYAEIVADSAQYVVNLLATNAGSVEDCVISDDSDENKLIVNEVNEILRDYTEQQLSWSFTVENEYVTGVVCSLKDYDKKSGAFPNEIPQKMNIPYDEKNLKNAKDFSFSWSENMPEFIDPTKADMPDFAEKSVTQLNTKAKAIFNCVNATIADYDANGVECPQGVISSDDKSDFVIDIREFGLIDINNFKWTAIIDKGVVTGVICTDKNEKSIGAYPNLVPMSMEIPYEADFAENAGDVEFSWKKEYPQYVSADPEKADLPDYPEEYIFGLNDKAKEMCDGFKRILFEYESEGKEIKDGLITSADDSEIADMLNNYAQTTLSVSEWTIKVEDYDIKGAVCSDFTSGTGAYPNNVPYGLCILYDTSYIDCASDKNADWNEAYDKYVNNMPLTISLKNVIVGSCNSYSKELYADISYVMTEYVAEGIEIPQGVVTYEDDTEFTKRINEMFAGWSDLKWSANIEGEIVTGCIVSRNDLLGAYPNAIENVFTDSCIKKVHLPYNSEYVVYAGDKEFKWETLLE